MSGKSQVCRVLVVEDHEVTRRSLSKLLQYSGHHVTTAGSFAEARRCLRAPFDAFILDVQLPDGNGLDLIREVSSFNSLAVIAIVTGSVQSKQLGDPISFGADVIFEKPVHGDEVLNWLSEHCYNRGSRG